MFKTVKKWLGRGSRSPVRSQPRRARPQLEGLGERLCPSGGGGLGGGTFVWVATAQSDKQWGTAANWDQNAVPTYEDDVIFDGDNSQQVGTTER